MFSLASLGYVLGWVIGILAAMITLSIAKELIFAGITAYAIKKFLDKTKDKEPDTIDVQGNFV